MALGVSVVDRPRRMWNADALEDFLGEEVVDREGNPVGIFACYWEREQGKALLLGVDIAGQNAGTHIVPARGARLNERQTYVQVLFTRDKVIQAPCLPCNREMDEEFERSVWDFYALPIPSRMAASGRRSQKDEATLQQLRRIVRRDPTAASSNVSPAGTSTPGMEANPSGPDRETPPPAADPRPADPSPVQTTRDSPSEDPFSV